MVKRESVTYRRSTWKVCAECGEEFPSQTSTVCIACKESKSLKKLREKHAQVQHLSRRNR